MLEMVPVSTKLQELRNRVDGTLRLQSNSPLDDDTWRACMKILNDKGLITMWSWTRVFTTT